MRVVILLSDFRLKKTVFLDSKIRFIFTSLTFFYLLWKKTLQKLKQTKIKPPIRNKKLRLTVIE